MKIVGLPERAGGVPPSGLPCYKRAMGKEKRRLDESLVAIGLAADTSEATGLILAGKVVVDDQRVDKPGTMIGLDQVVRLKGKQAPFVSRAGEKLAGALDDFGLTESIPGMQVIDVGSSTGGFTDCLLKAGAAHVFSVDVVTNQLDFRLRRDERVTVMERLDIRSLDIETIPALDLVVADISFNSLVRLSDALWRLPAQGELIFVLLVKPQFELAGSEIDKGGLVTDPALQQKAVDLVRKRFTELGATNFAEMKSGVLGRTGNQEFFLKFARQS